MRTKLQLAPAEIEALLKQYALTHSPEYRDRVVEAHLYIAEIIARKFSGRGVDFDDLYQVAAMALFKAVDRFDPERGIKFASYVTPGMVGEVKNYFRDKARAIRPPRRSVELIKTIESAKDELLQQLSRYPTLDEIAEYTGLEEDTVLEVLEAAASQPVSLDMQLSDEEDDYTLASSLGAQEKGFGEFENADMLARAMAKLNEQQREVIRLRFFENRSQREVAAALEVSQMSVSRAERRALEILREELKYGEDR